MDCLFIVSIFLCFVPQIIITQEVNRHQGKGGNVEVNSENIVYYSEDDIQRLVRQSTVLTFPYGNPASASQPELQRKQQQSAIVYNEPIANRFGQRPLLQRPLDRSQNRLNGFQGVQTTPTTTSPPLIKVPITKNEGPVLVTPLQNEVLPGPPPAEPDNENHNQPPVPLTTNFDRSSVAIANFGLNLMQAVQDTKSAPGNIVVSPYSIATTLALLQQGAFGETQRQISEALQMSPENSAAMFKKFVNAIRKQRISRNILRVATNVYIAPTFTLNPAFRSTAIHVFGSDVTPQDFNSPELAAMTINNWVALKTDQQITKLLSPESISHNSQLVLANAVYFKGLWQTMFNLQATETKDFVLSNKQKKPVPYMKMRKQLKTGIDFTINSQVIFLPFEGELYSLMMLLPAENVKLDDVIQKLQANQLLSYHNLPAKEVQIEIPRFTIKAETDLNPVFRQMGVANIFNQNSELFGIGNYRNFSALISSAQHTAILSIDEKGGSAAAATAFAVVALSYEDPSDYFKANRPFLAVLWNEELAAPMFMAKIEDPTL